MARLKARIQALEAPQEPSCWHSEGLAPLLAHAALHPPAPWELPTLEALTDEPTGLARCLLEARQWQRQPS
jgi:hypothetical protein